MINLNKSLTLILVLSIYMLSCQSDQRVKDINSQTSELIVIRSDNFHLHAFSKNPEAILILFGGYPETADDIQREFKILDHIKQHDLAVICMNFNQHLWLEAEDKEQLDSLLNDIFEANQLPKDRLFFGGFSSGGNVALHLANYLTAKQSALAPEGVFVIDSPIDLLALYRSSEKHISRQFSEVSVQESEWIIQHLSENFGEPIENFTAYERASVFSYESRNIDNLKALKNTKIRLYSEPDTLWWRENRLADWDQLNAFYLENLSLTLKDSGFIDVEYIVTKNRGYRADGSRHPHSWSIVDKEELIRWKLK